MSRPTTNRNSQHGQTSLFTVHCSLFTVYCSLFTDIFRRDHKFRHILIILTAVLLLLPACGQQTMPARPRQMPGGDPQQGWQFLQDYGCHSCHTIPGVPRANATVGPPLNDWADRHYIAGRLPNTPENLLLFVQFPQTVSPGIAMPDMGVTEQDARDIGAYLYTLRRSAWQELWR